MAMVHGPRHTRGASSPQGSALCMGVALAGLVLAAMALNWLFGLIRLFF